MAWYVFAFAAVVLSALATVFQKITLKDNEKSGVYATSTILSFLIFVFLLIYVSIAHSFVMPPFATIWWIAIINLVLALIGWLTGKKALSLLGSGEYTVLMTVRVVITWVASILLLSIGVTSHQAMGVVLVLAAVLVVFYRRNGLAEANKIGLLLTLATALNYGFGTIIDQLIYRVSDPASYGVIGFGVNTLLLLMIKPKTLRSFSVLIKPRKTLMYAVAAVLTGAATVLLFTALKVANNATTVTAISQTQLILVAVFGALLIRAERKQFARVLTGAVIAALAVVLILT